jgi:hypothetical protein
VRRICRRGKDQPPPKFTKSLTSDEEDEDAGHTEGHLEVERFCHAQASWDTTPQIGRRPDCPGRNSALGQQKPKARAAETAPSRALARG